MNFHPTRVDSLDKFRSKLILGTRAMNSKFSIHLICLNITLLLVACSPSADEETTKSFEVLGYVEAPLDEKNRLTVDHEDIPGYMPPMIMLFNVSDPDDAAHLNSGDQIRFTYRVTSSRSWIENLVPTGKRRDPNVSETAAASEAGELLNQGDRLPDYSFLDEEGEEVSLSDYRGSVVAISFIFTRCPVPEYCPAMMRNFGNVDTILSRSDEASFPWKLVTISFDPENDTPEAMKRYGAAFDYSPEKWDLLTSKTLEPIEGIAANVGLKYGKRNGSYLHNLRTVVLDTSGNIRHVFTDENWSPQELAAKMREAASL